MAVSQIQPAQAAADGKEVHELVTGAVVVQEAKGHVLEQGAVADKGHVPGFEPGVG